MLASRHTTGLCWTAEILPDGEKPHEDNFVTVTSVWIKRPNMNISTPKSFMCKMQKCVQPKTDNHVPFIHRVEMGGLLHYFV